VTPPLSQRNDPDSPLARFERGMEMNYEKWHDGIGYDLDALRAASNGERAEAFSALCEKIGVDARRYLA